MNDWVEKAAEEIWRLLPGNVFPGIEGRNRIAAIIRRHRDEDPAEKEAKERAAVRGVPTFDP